MLRLYVPVAVTVVLIASLTAWESIYSDRFTGSSVTAEEFGKRFTALPPNVGDWVGENHEVDAKTLEVAGAVNHVSRTYRNNRTGEAVDLWLVVGHARDICRHTPDVCYPSQGFAQDGENQKHRVEVKGEPDPAMFYTARFRNEANLMDDKSTRVFWAWNANQPDNKAWVAPDNQRTEFGNNTALYKMYFTSRMPHRDQPVADNVAMEFAQVMLPAVNRALFPERYAGQADASPAAAAKKAVADAKAGDAAAIGDAAVESTPAPAAPATADSVAPAAGDKAAPPVEAPKP